jgi:hypothetical protein
MSQIEADLTMIESSSGRKTFVTPDVMESHQGSISTPKCIGLFFDIVPDMKSRPALSFMSKDWIYSEIYHGSLTFILSSFCSLFILLRIERISEHHKLSWILYSALRVALSFVAIFEISKLKFPPRKNLPKRPSFR